MGPLQIRCKTILCNGNAHQLEQFNFTGQYYAAAARCNDCCTMYWMYKRDNKITLVDRKVPDQRKNNRKKSQQDVYSQEVSV